jgi:hypothetical protein
MRVELDNGRAKVDLEVENGTDKFLNVLLRALRAMGYSGSYLLRELSKEGKND